MLYWVKTMGEAHYDHHNWDSDTLVHFQLYASLHTSSQMLMSALTCSSSSATSICPYWAV